MLLTIDIPDDIIPDDTACSVNKCNAFVINWGYTQFRPDSLMSRYSLDFRRKSSLLMNWALAQFGNSQTSL